MRAMTLPHRRLVLLVLSCLAALLFGSGVLAAQTPVLISPALPTTSDQVVLVVEPTCLDIANVPTVAGTVITLKFGPTPAVPAGSCPVAQSYPLGLLDAGSYTVKQVDFSDNVLSTSVFEVTAPSTTLDLLAGRFVASASWYFTRPIPVGVPQTQPASAVQVADHSGYFWFFDPGTIEVSIKILDGTAFNGHYWVIIASSTTVPYDLTVVDTRGDCLLAQTPCPTKTYQSTSGTNQNFVDIEAFSNPPAP
jgi:hypothetical protein